MGTASIVIGLASLVLIVSLVIGMLMAMLYKRDRVKPYEEDDEISDDEI